MVSRAYARAKAQYEATTNEADLPKSALMTRVIDIDFEGNDLAMYGVTVSKRARVQFYEGATLRQGLDLNVNDPFVWWSTLGTNPLAGFAISSMTASCGETTDADGSGSVRRRALQPVMTRPLGR